MALKQKEPGSGRSLTFRMGTLGVNLWKGIQELVSWGFSLGAAAHLHSTSPNLFPLGLV